MKVKARILIAGLFAMLLAACNSSANESNKNNKHQAIGLSADLQGRLVKMVAYPLDSNAIPRSIEDGKLRGIPSKDWTSGFFPGNLWYAYRLTNDSVYLERARALTDFIEKEKWNDRTHDMGFKIYCSFGNGYEITGDPHYKEVIVQAANTLITRFNPNVGAIKSWDFGMDRWQFPVIIDNMMNLELLFEATNLTGDSTYYNIAYSHALTTLQNHYRGDYSSYHVVDYDPNTGEVIKKITHQGFSDESSWSRGQAWGLYGFVMSYRYTQEEKFLEMALHIKDLMLQHPNVPEDGIFYWDFDDPAIPNAPRDASAAAITASALLELYNYDQDEAYLQKAQDIMAVLSSDYILDEGNTAPFILDKSTGNVNKDDEINVPLVYADYYYLEALWRQKERGK